MINLRLYYDTPQIYLPFIAIVHSLLSQSEDMYNLVWTYACLCNPTMRIIPAPDTKEPANLPYDIFSSRKGKSSTTASTSNKKSKTTSCQRTFPSTWGFNQSAETETKNVTIGLRRPSLTTGCWQQLPTPHGDFSVVITAAKIDWQRRCCRWNSLLKAQRKSICRDV